MLAKVVYIDIVNKPYPMVFSLACMKDMKGFDEISKRAKEDKDISDSAEIIIRMLTTLITSGCNYCNRLKMTGYKNSPAINGYIKPLTRDDIQYLIPATKESLYYVVKKIQLCVDVSKSKSITAVTPPGSKKKKKR